MAGKIKKTDRGKAWNRKKLSSKPYPIERRDKRKAFLILCEGLNSEPEYFKAFPLNNASIRAIGLGMSKTSLVERARRITSNDADISRKEVWIVFDRDGTPEEKANPEPDFDKAIRLAKQYGFKVAYSNDVFELWFLLHYQELSTPWTRHQYFEALSRIWNCDYITKGKKKEFCRKIYQRLKLDENASQEAALLRAKVLLETQKDLPYSSQNPHAPLFFSSSSS